MADSYYNDVLKRLSEGAASPAAPAPRAPMSMPTPIKIAPLDYMRGPSAEELALEAEIGAMEAGQSIPGHLSPEAQIAKNEADAAVINQVVEEEGPGYWSRLLGQGMEMLSTPLEFAKNTVESAGETLYGAGNLVASLFSDDPDYAIQAQNAFERAGAAGARGIGNIVDVITTPPAALLGFDGLGDEAAKTIQMGANVFNDEEASWEGAERSLQRARDTSAGTKDNRYTELGSSWRPRDVAAEIGHHVFGQEKTNTDPSLDTDMFSEFGKSKIQDFLTGFAFVLEQALDPLNYVGGLAAKGRQAIDATRSQVPRAARGVIAQEDEFARLIPEGMSTLDVTSEEIGKQALKLFTKLGMSAGKAQAEAARLAARFDERVVRLTDQAIRQAPEETRKLFQKAGFAPREGKRKLFQSNNVYDNLDIIKKAGSKNLDLAGTWKGQWEQGARGLFPQVLKDKMPASISKVMSTIEGGVYGTLTKLNRVRDGSGARFFSASTKGGEQAYLTSARRAAQANGETMVATAANLAQATGKAKFAGLTSLATSAGAGALLGAGGVWLGSEVYYAANGTPAGQRNLLEGIAEGAAFGALLSGAGQGVIRKWFITDAATHATQQAKMEAEDVLNSSVGRQHAEIEHVTEQMADVWARLEADPDFTDHDTFKAQVRQSVEFKGKIESDQAKLNYRAKQNLHRRRAAEALQEVENLSTTGQRFPEEGAEVGAADLSRIPEAQRVYQRELEMAGIDPNDVVDSEQLFADAAQEAHNIRSLQGGINVRRQEHADSFKHMRTEVEEMAKLYEEGELINLHFMQSNHVHIDGLRSDRVAYFGRTFSDEMQEAMQDSAVRDAFAQASDGASSLYDSVPENLLPRKLEDMSWEEAEAEMRKVLAPVFEERGLQMPETIFLDDPKAVLERNALNAQKAVKQAQHYWAFIRQFDGGSSAAKDELVRRARNAAARGTASVRTSEAEREAAKPAKAAAKAAPGFKKQVEKAGKKAAKDLKPVEEKLDEALDARLGARKDYAQASDDLFDAQARVATSTERANRTEQVGEALDEGLRARKHSSKRAAEDEQAKAAEAARRRIEAVDARVAEKRAELEGLIDTMEDAPRALQREGRKSLGSSLDAVDRTVKGLADRAEEVSQRQAVRLDNDAARLREEADRLDDLAKKQEDIADAYRKSADLDAEAQAARRQAAEARTLLGASGQTLSGGKKKPAEAFSNSADDVAGKLDAFDPGGAAKTGNGTPRKWAAELPAKLESEKQHVKDVLDELDAELEKAVAAGDPQAARAAVDKAHAALDAGAAHKRLGINKAEDKRIKNVGQRIANEDVKGRVREALDPLYASAAGSASVAGARAGKALGAALDAQAGKLSKSAGALRKKLVKDAEDAISESQRLRTELLTGADALAGQLDASKELRRQAQDIRRAADAAAASLDSVPEDLAAIRDAAKGLEDVLGIKIDDGDLVSIKAKVDAMGAERSELAAIDDALEEAAERQADSTETMLDLSYDMKERGATLKNRPLTDVADQRADEIAALARAEREAEEALQADLRKQAAEARGEVREHLRGLYQDAADQERDVLRLRLRTAMGENKSEAFISEKLEPLVDDFIGAADEDGSATSFRTAKGSTYEVSSDGGRTTRNKAKRPEHGDDSGIKKQSEATVYVPRDQGSLLSFPDGVTPAWVIDADEGTIRPYWYSEKKGGYVAPPDQVIKYTTEPSVGAMPVEVWDAQHQHGSKTMYGNLHLGNEIVEVTGKNGGLSEGRQRALDRIYLRLEDQRGTPLTLQERGNIKDSLQAIVDGAGVQPRDVAANTTAPSSLIHKLYKRFVADDLAESGKRVSPQRTFNAADNELITSEVKQAASRYAVDLDEAGDPVLDFWYNEIRAHPDFDEIVQSIRAGDFEGLSQIAADIAGAVPSGQGLLQGARSGEDIMLAIMAHERLFRSALGADVMRLSAKELDLSLAASLAGRRAREAGVIEKLALNTRRKARALRKRIGDAPQRRADIAAERDARIAGIQERNAAEQADLNSSIQEVRDAIDKAHAQQGVDELNLAGTQTRTTSTRKRFERANSAAAKGYAKQQKIRQGYQDAVAGAYKRINDDVAAKAQGLSPDARAMLEVSGEISLEKASELGVRIAKDGKPKVGKVLKEALGDHAEIADIILDLAKEKAGHAITIDDILVRMKPGQRAAYIKKIAGKGATPPAGKVSALDLALEVAPHAVPNNIEDLADLALRMIDMPEAVAFRELRKLPQTAGATRKFLKFWDGLLGVFRKAALMIPASVAKDMIGGFVTNTILAGATPRDLWYAAKAYSHTFKPGSKMGRAFKRLGRKVDLDKPMIQVAEGQRSLNHLVNEARQIGLFAGDTTFGAEVSKQAPFRRSLTKAGKRFGKKAEQAVGDAVDTLDAVPNSMIAMREHSDNYHRFAAYLHARGALGLSPEDSARYAKTFFFDYSDVTKMEQHVLRRMTFFYTFARKSVPLALQSIVDRPFRLRLMLLASGNRQEEESYIGEANSHVLSRDANGVPTTLSIGDNSISAFMNMARASDGADMGRRMANTLAPPIKSALEYMSGVDFYTNKKRSGSLDDIQDGRTNNRAPDWLRFVFTPDGQNMLGFNAEVSADGKTRRYVMKPHLRWFFESVMPLGTASNALSDATQGFGGGLDQSVASGKIEQRKTMRDGILNQLGIKYRQEHYNSDADVALREISKVAEIAREKLLSLPNHPVTVRDTSRGVVVAPNLKTEAGIALEEKIQAACDQVDLWAETMRAKGIKIGTAEKDAMKLSAEQLAYQEVNPKLWAYKQVIDRHSELRGELRKIKAGGKQEYYEELQVAWSELLSMRKERLAKMKARRLRQPPPTKTLPKVEPPLGAEEALKKRLLVAQSQR